VVASAASAAAATASLYRDVSQLPHHGMNKKYRPPYSTLQNPLLMSSVEQASTPVRKSSKGITQMLLKFQKKE